MVAEREFLKDRYFFIRLLLLSARLFFLRVGGGGGGGGGVFFFCICGSFFVFIHVFCNSQVLLSSYYGLCTNATMGFHDRQAKRKWASNHKNAGR